MPQLDWLPKAVRVRRPVCVLVVEVKPSPVGGATLSSVVVMVTPRRISTVTPSTCGLGPPAPLTVSVKLSVEGMGTSLETTNWNGAAFVASAPDPMLGQEAVPGGTTVTPGVSLASVPATPV